MAGVSLDLTQVHDLAHDLRSGAQDTEVNVKIVVREAGAATVDGFHARVPVRTGADQHSATVSSTGLGLGFEAGPHTDYAAYVELGTSKMSPEPALGPAFDAVEPVVVRRIGDVGEGLLG